jgi:hypothetical protein
LWNLRNYLLRSNDRVKTPRTMSRVQFPAKRLIDLAEYIGVKGVSRRWARKIPED